jgi:hypothetical protein
MATSRGSVTQPTAKSNGNLPRATGFVDSTGRAYKVRGPGQVPNRRLNIRSR